MKHVHLLASLMALAFAPALAAAQTPAQGPPNALQGFSQNRNEPVQIEAATLEVREKDKQATFSGNVKVVQGDTTMRSKVLIVFYDQDDAKNPAGAGNMKAATPGPGGQQSIKRLEAKGSVSVTQKDQTATGESGLFDMKTNTVTMSGGVVMTQGQNVLRGDRLIVDLTTGVSRVESGKGGNGRVQGLFHSSGNTNANPNANTNSANPSARPEDGNVRSPSSFPGMPSMPARPPARTN